MDTLFTLFSLWSECKQRIGHESGLCGFLWSPPEGNLSWVLAFMDSISHTPHTWDWLLEQVFPLSFPYISYILTLSSREVLFCHGWHLWAFIYCLFDLSKCHKCLGEWNSYERAPKKKKKTQQFTYGQYIFTDCTEVNVQNTHTYTQYTQCTIKTYLVTNTPIHIIHRMYTSALCPHLCIVICEGATDYNLQ